MKMMHSKFISGMGLGLAVGVVATGMVAANRKEIMRSKAAKALRSVGHTVSGAVNDIGGAFRR